MRETRKELQTASLRVFLSNLEESLAKMARQVIQTYGEEGWKRIYLRKTVLKLRIAIFGKREVYVKIFISILLAVMLTLVSWSAFAVSWGKSDHLFFIERNKNRNYVQYDAHLTKDDDLLASNPVTTYWVLENGGQEKLSLIERRYAYGIDSQEKLELNKFRILLVALKDRDIIVEKVNGSFRAMVSINGNRSILEKVYIESKERLIGLPEVLYIDLFGETKGLPVRERIIPK